MQQAELEQIVTYLDKLIASTQANQINWTKTNPTTYVWHIPQKGNSRLIIQSVERGTGRIVTNRIGMPAEEMLKYCVFQAMDQANVELLTIDGSTDQTLNGKLRLLFQAIESCLARKGIDFLKSIIPPGK